MISLIMADAAWTLASSPTPAGDNPGERRHRLKAITKTTKALL
jgi:hypothetical protein